MSDSSRPTPDQLAEKVREGFTSVVTAPDGELCVDTGNSYDASLALSELVARLAASEAAREQAEQERDEALAKWAACDDAFSLVENAAETAREDCDRLAAALEQIASSPGVHYMVVAREALAQTQEQP